MKQGDSTNSSTAHGESSAAPPPPIKAEAIRGALFGGKVMILIFLGLLEGAWRFVICMSLVFDPAGRLLQQMINEVVQKPVVMMGEMIIGVAMTAVYGAVPGALIMTIGALRRRRKYRKAHNG